MDALRPWTVGNSDDFGIWHNPKTLSTFSVSVESLFPKLSFMIAPTAALPRQIRNESRMAVLGYLWIFLLILGCRPSCLANAMSPRREESSLGPSKSLSTQQDRKQPSFLRATQGMEHEDQSSAFRMKSHWLLSWSTDGAKEKKDTIAGNHNNNDREEKYHLGTTAETWRDMLPKWISTLQDYPQGERNQPPQYGHALFRRVVRGSRSLGDVELVDTTEASMSSSFVEETASTSVAVEEPEPYSPVQTWTSPLSTTTTTTTSNEFGITESPAPENGEFSSPMEWTPSEPVEQQHETPPEAAVGSALLDSEQQPLEQFGGQDGADEDADWGDEDWDDDEEEPNQIDGNDDTWDDDEDDDEWNDDEPAEQLEGGQTDDVVVMYAPDEVDSPGVQPEFDSQGNIPTKQEETVVNPEIQMGTTPATPTTTISGTTEYGNPPPSITPPVPVSPTMAPYGPSEYGNPPPSITPPVPESPAMAPYGPSGYVPPIEMSPPTPRPTGAPTAGLTLPLTPGPTPQPTPRPTTTPTPRPVEEKSVYKANDDETDDKTQQTDDLWNDDKTNVGKDNDDSTDDEYAAEVEEAVEKELQEEERKVKVLSASGVLLGIMAMIFTAYQMSENPDGIYAAACRFCITVLVCLFRIILSPCKGLFGYANNRHLSHYGHVPVSTMDYGYRDPSVELQLQ